MTTVVVWRVQENPFDRVPAGSIMAISDSRASRHDGSLTDNCAKIFEVEVACEVRQSRELIGSTQRKRITVATAGNTLVAHNVVFDLQQSLVMLVGPEMPTMDEIAEYALEVTTKITKEVGFKRQHEALTEIVLIGPDADGEVKAISIRPSPLGQTLYKLIPIAEPMYAFGSGAKKFIEKYNWCTESDLDEESRSQQPIFVFDELFLVLNGDDHTGGELQMVATTPSRTVRFLPMRWDFTQDRYVYAHPIVGKARVGYAPWQLNERRRH